MTLGNTKVERPPNQLHLEGAGTSPSLRPPFSSKSARRGADLFFLAHTNSEKPATRAFGRGQAVESSANIRIRQPDTHRAVWQCTSASSALSPFSTNSLCQDRHEPPSNRATEQPQAANPANVGECCELRRIPHRARASRYNASQRLCQTGNPFYDFGR